MEDTLYIVLWRSPEPGSSYYRWRQQANGIFTQKHLAEKMIECLRDAEPQWEYGYVAGPITSPKQMEEQEALLPTF